MLCYPSIYSFIECVSNIKYLKINRYYMISCTNANYIYIYYIYIYIYMYTCDSISISQHRITLHPVAPRRLAQRIHPRHARPISDTPWHPPARFFGVGKLPGIPSPKIPNGIYIYIYIYMYIHIHYICMFMYIYIYVYV